MVAQVNLIMHQTFGKHKYVRFLEHLCVKLVGGVDEAHCERPLEDGEDLGASWVCVEVVDPTGQILQQGCGDAEAGERRERLGIHTLDGEFRRWGEAGAAAEALVCEVVTCDGALVCARGEEEVGCELRVGGLRWSWEKN